MSQYSWFTVYVSDVTWLDDVADITEPLETMDTNTVETYYKDKNALLSITIEEDKRIQAVEDIREIIGDENSMMGSAVSTAAATTPAAADSPAHKAPALRRRGFLLYGLCLFAKACAKNFSQDVKKMPRGNPALLPQQRYTGMRTSARYWEVNQACLKYPTCLSA